MLNPAWRPFLDMVRKVAKENNIKVDDIFICTPETPFPPDAKSPYRHFYHSQVERFIIDGITVRQCLVCHYDIDSGVKCVNKIQGEYLC